MKSPCATTGRQRLMRGRFVSILLLCTGGFVGLNGLGFCSSAICSPTSRSKSNVRVRFFQPGSSIDTNKDGKISPEELRQAMGRVQDKGKFNVRDFFAAVGLSEEELSTVFTVVGESGRQRLFGAINKDLDMGTVYKGFPYFNAELNDILPGLPRFSSSYKMDKDGDGKISETEFQEALDWITTKASITIDDFYKKVGSSEEVLRSTFNTIDDGERIHLWQALVRDVELGNKDFPLFASELKVMTNKEHKKYVSSITRRL